jgi:hypothetical protein
LIFVCALALAGCGETAENAERARAEIEKSVLNDLRPGDILFRRGGGLTSRAVLAVDAEGIYSHTGIVVSEGPGDEKGPGGTEGSGDSEGPGSTERSGDSEVPGAAGSAKFTVVHLVPGETGGDVIKRETIGEFFSRERALKGAVMRLKGADDPLGTEAGLAGSAAREALRLSATTLMFDHAYDLDDTTRMYCTELVWQVFRRQGVDLTGGRRTKINMPGFNGLYILPTDIARNPQLELVYSF